MMTPPSRVLGLRIGLGLANTTARAIVVRRGKIVWASEVQRDEHEPIAAVVRTVLDGAPLPRWPRPGVVIALGPSLAQVKPLSGLPAVQHAHTLSDMVQEGAGRFFLKNGAPLRTSAVRQEPAGVVWAAAVDEFTIVELMRGCAMAQARLASVVPTVAVLPRITPETRIDWADVPVHVRVEAVDGRLTRLSRSHRPADPATVPTVPALDSLGVEGWRFADAYGAATASAESLTFEVPRHVQAATPVPSWRWWAALTAATVGITAMLLLPVMADVSAARTAGARLAALAPRQRAAQALETSLRETSAALQQVAVFGDERRPLTTVLAGIAAALPDRSAVLEVRVDARQVGLVVLTPQVSVVLSRLDKTPGIIGPAIVGPVQRESVTGHELERATIQFTIGQPSAQRSR